MGDLRASPRPAVLRHWRGLYAETAKSESWLAAHQWEYGPDVALATAIDVRDKLRLSPQDRLLELGCGSGAFMDAVMHAGQSGVGFDLCDEQIRAVNKFGVDKNRIKLGVAEAARIPVPDESYDKVLCYSVAHYFPDDDYLRLAILEMLRVCRKGGLILLGDVAGVMERTRKILLRWGLPPRLADAGLWACLPVRHLYRACRGRRPREGRFFRRSFLIRLLGELPCEFEILEQDIPGRPASRCRFDIRMVKR